MTKSFVEAKPSLTGGHRKYGKCPEKAFSTIQTLIRAVSQFLRCFSFFGDKLKMKSELIDVSELQLYFPIRNANQPENKRLDSYCSSKKTKDVDFIKEVFCGENNFQTFRSDAFRFYTL